MVILYLILPLVFYSLVTGVIALILPLQAVTCTLLGAVVTFPVLCYWPYRSDQARRGVIPPIPFRFRGCLPVIILLGIGTCISVNNIISLTPLPELSSGFEAVRDTFYSPPLLIQILGPGVLIPAAEEMIFRGLMFAPLRDRSDIGRTVWTLPWQSASGSLRVSPWTGTGMALRALPDAGRSLALSCGGEYDIHHCCKYRSGDSDREDGPFCVWHRPGSGSSSLGFLFDQNRT